MPWTYPKNTKSFPSGEPSVACHVQPASGEVKPYRARWNVSDREAAAAGWSALDRLLK